MRESGRVGRCYGVNQAGMRAGRTSHPAGSELSPLVAAALALFTDTLLVRFTAQFRWLEILLALLVLHEDAGAGHHFLESVYGTIDAFVIFNFYSEHVVSVILGLF
jgi:hypothetical protein